MFRVGGRDSGCGIRVSGFGNGLVVTTCALVSSGSYIRDEGLGLRVQYSVFRVEGSVVVFRVEGSVFGVCGLQFKGSGSSVRFWGRRFRVSGMVSGTWRHVWCGTALFDPDPGFGPGFRFRVSGM